MKNHVKNLIEKYYNLSIEMNDVSVKNFSRVDYYVLSPTGVKMFCIPVQFDKIGRATQLAVQQYTGAYDCPLRKLIDGN